MKKNIIISLMLSSAMFIGCDNVLDKQPLDSFTNDNFWTKEANVEMYANYFYAEWTGYGNGGGSGSYYYPTLNDNQVGSSFSTFTKSVPGNSGTWNSCYTEIRRANIMLEKVPGISTMNDATKNNWLGIARLYRAWQHYCLVRTFGDCIWVGKTLDVTAEDKEQYLYAARQDRDAVMDNILEDLNFAIANITKNASSRTAYNATVAQAMKAEICLYEGTFCKYRSSADGQKAADPARAQKYLQECKTACEAIMGNSMYKLNDDYQANYNSLDLAGNTEMIMYKKYLVGVLLHSLIDYTCSSTQMSGMSKAAFDSYLFTDGLPKATTKMDTNDHGVEFKGDDGQQKLNIENVLATRDPRLSAHVDPVLLYPGNGYTRFGEGMVSTSSSGYGVYKFDNSSIPTNFRNQTNSNETDAPIFWLAEIYLDYAEACAELGNCTQSDLDKSINLLRKRVGMPDMTVDPVADPANNMGVSNLIWEIRRERRVELMYDKNDRYWSLIRWHQLDKLDSQKYPDIFKGAWVGTLKADANVDENGYIDAAKGDYGTRIYDAKNYLEPIPSGQSDLNPKLLPNNYGWDK
jgi:hypothetical protein